MGIEFKGRREVGTRQHFGQEDMRRLERRLVLPRRQRLPHRTGARVAKRKDFVLREIAERRAQQGGEIEVVFPLQHKAAQRHQVHHRDLFGQGDAIRAGYRDAAQLQLPDDLAAEGLAPRQQDHDVAGADRCVMAGKNRARSSRSRIWSATRLASTTTGLSGCSASTGR